MKMRRILSFALALTMLLSLFSGMSFANAAAPRMVPVGEELAYDPLAETASIAYEQHEDGYAVTLDRAADSVTMHLTAVPDSGRKAEGARLYIRTGTELKAGTAYRVSFALWSEKKLTEYTACFDGADTASAYGKLEKRSIEAGGTDRVEYLVTPEKESGELVLRLLLGGAESGALRLSGLAVEESSAEAAGNNVMLVDKLDYNAPGSVTIWTNDDYSATLTTRGESATMTMTEVPKTGKEVWKAKLLVATGLHLEAGKTYRVRADLQSSGGQKYELCFNSGDTEKGYDVLYNQNLGSEVEHLIYVPTYKTDLGELIIQFSLGNLSKGAVTTIRDVRVDEVKAVYKNMLDGDFSFEGSRVKKTYDDLMIHTDNGTEVAKVKWDDGTVVTKSGDRAGQMDVDADQGSATLEVKAGSTNHPWDARLNVDVAGSFENDAIYRVSFNLHSLLAFNCELQIGKTFAADGIGCDPYDISFHWINPGDNEVMYLFSAKASERHLFQLLVGETHGAANTVTLSNLKVERMDGGTVSTTELASVTYPESGNNAIEMAGNPWGNRAMYTVTSDHKIVLKVLETPGDGVWKSKIIIDTGVANAEGKTVQFDIKALEKNEANWEVLIGSGAHSENMRKVVGDKEITSTGIKNGNETSPFSTTTNNNTAGTVFITLQLGISQNTYEISNIKVGETDVM